ncbi:uncharacterized protein LOC110031123 isoform X2 [Phalaenopsis equestris]|uniref:uncharacterized protein LOC110031123 isoform X2 n=1 Tax=Phalaenopsis equestris TaxID=78828 RepID=UPI0009E2ED67|nr:uncharacterized protein LOC110031123 isoform X2 [Phalaenopsis equestris]
MAAASLPLTPLHFSPAKLRNTLHESTRCTTYLLGKMMRRSRRCSQAVAAYNSDGNGDPEGDEKQSSFSPFGFVTNNPSSRNAIQLPETPAEDGNVGQMLYRIEDKGRDYGSYVESGDLRWFVRETGSSSSQRGSIIFLHGAPTQSYSYREVMSQGFLVGSYGLTWALRNSDKVSKIAVLNSPLSARSSLPGLFQKLRIPLIGEFTCQNAIMAERFIESGSPYVLKLEKADVYRLPYLASSGPGFALLEAARKANFRDVLNRIAAGFSSTNWDKLMLLAWGASDKYLPVAEAEAFQKTNPEAIQLKVIEGAGHMPQEDWPEKVVEALRRFL